MRTAVFYPCGYIAGAGVVHTYSVALEDIERGFDIGTTQMCLLNKVKDYDEVLIREDGYTIVIVNNHDGTYSCDRTDRTLRRIHNFFHLWENGEFRRGGE